MTFNFFVFQLPNSSASPHSIDQTSRKMTDVTRLKATVYVGGLASMVNAANLHAAFIPFGEIVDISLPKPEAPSSTELHRGFGYVEFEDPADAKEAIDNLDQAELFGRVIKVSAAKPQKNANEGLGSKTAVWEQVSETQCWWSL